MTGLRIALVAVAAVLASGCMFRMKHELPPRSYFGSLPEASGETRVPFEEGGMKNWALAGLLPYSRWGTKNLLLPRTDLERRESLEIETRFGVADTIIWVVPGFFYGYYVWAPRSVYVRGNEVASSAPRR